MKHRSDADIKFIKQNYFRLGARGIERELDISASSVRRIAQALGLKKNEALEAKSAFTPEMDVKLVELYEKQGLTQYAVAEALGVTYPQVNRRLMKLGIRKHGIKHHGLHWTQEEVDRLCELVKSHQVRTISIILERPVHSVRKKLNEIGLSHTLKAQPDCVLMRGANGKPPHTMLDILSDFEPSLAYWERQLNTRWREKLDVENADEMQYQVNSMVERLYLALNGPYRIDDLVQKVTALMCEFKAFANTNLSSQLVAKMRNSTYKLRTRNAFSDHPRMLVVIRYFEQKTPVAKQLESRFKESA